MKDDKNMIPNATFALSFAFARHELIYVVK